MKKLNRSIGIVLSLTLLLSCFSGTAFAATEASEAVGDGENGSYAISSLYVIGSSQNGAYEWLNGAGNYMLSEANLMTDYGYGQYKIDFYDVPGGSGYEFKIAAPTENGTYEFGVFNYMDYGSGISNAYETYHALDLYGNYIYLDPEARANVSITVDTNCYDPFYGTGLTMSVYIEYTEQRYAVECCQELNDYYGLSSDMYPYLEMFREDDHYTCTLYDIPYTSQMLWCSVIPLDNQGIIDPIYSFNDYTVYFKADPNYYGSEPPHAFITYYPDMHYVDIFGVGIVAPNSSGFYSMTLETGSQNWFVNGDYETSFQMEPCSYDYGNGCQYEITFFDLDPITDYSSGNPDDGFYEFYFKTDSNYMNPLVCDSDSENEFISNGFDVYCNYSNLVQSDYFYDLGTNLPRFKLTTKSDVKITVTLSNDNMGTGDDISMSIEITPKAPIYFISGTENLAGENWSSTPTAENTMHYIDNGRVYFSTYLDNVGEIYQFYVLDRYEDEITRHGYDDICYTYYTYNLVYNSETDSYDLPGDVYGLYPYRFELTEPGYVEIVLDEYSGSVYINGDGIRTLAPFEFTKLSILSGHIFNESSGELEGLYPNTNCELTPMECDENGYSLKFKNVPAGDNYCFSVVADPALNYYPDYYNAYYPDYVESFPAQFILSADQCGYYPIGDYETVYFTTPIKQMIRFDLDINADVEIIFDDENYDIESGTGGSITLKITPIKGDVNGDGGLDITDATDIQYALAELWELSPAQTDNGDVDRDGQLSIKDVTMIQKYLAGMIESL